MSILIEIMAYMLFGIIGLFLGLLLGSGFKMIDDFFDTSKSDKQ